MNIKVIGVGGIGCQLLPTLCRFLCYEVGKSGEDVALTLIDGDTFERDNASRQALIGDGNKALAAAEKLGNEFGSLWLDSEPVYIEEDNCYSLLQEDDLIFLCVDNHFTRYQVSNRCEDLQNVVLISGGNEYTHGNIQVYIRRNGENLTLPLANEFHPEIANHDGRHPAQAGCAEAAVSAPQLIITNNAIATAMLNAFYSILQDGTTGYDEAYVDIRTNAVRPVSRSQR